VIALLALGREAGLGERRRIETWQAVIAASGEEAVTIPLLRDFRTAMWPPRRPAMAAPLTGAAALETLAWSWPATRHLLSRLQPDAVVAVTVRAYHPAMVEVAPHVVLDFVDRLSVSYQDRARLPLHPLRRALFRTLGITTDALERRRLAAAVRPVAAGRSDAAALGATWVPNVVTIPGADPDAAPPDHDVLFFGNLRYPPNVDAVAFLADTWPKVLAARPDTRLLLAGRQPGPEVVRDAERLGWTIEADFRDLAALCARARVAAAPLQLTAGIQNKVLEAAAHGVPQVITPQVLAGVGADFPARVAGTPGDFAAALVALLDDDAGRLALAAAARQHVAQEFSPEVWAERLRHQGLLDG
jgi:glycosyltransferase involved in cell wall biosynthesis